MINLGKYFSILISVCAIINLAAVPVLSLKDRQGIALKTVGWRQPFLIELAVDGAHSLHDHAIPGLDQFEIMNVSSSLSSINGHGVAKYVYEVVAKKQGESVIGPAQIVIQGVTQHSNMLTVLVSNQEELSDQSSRQKVRQPRAFLQVEAKNCTYYVGQKIPVKLRFYFNTDFIALHSIIPSVPEEIKKTETIELQGGSQDVAGFSYMYREWEWNFYISKPGTYTIPAYAADFSVKKNNHSVPWQAFSLWGARSVGKRVYSNALKLEVIPLPATARPAQAIGSFSIYSLELNQETARVGDALTLTAQILGDTDYESLPFPDITGFSDSLKIYPSQQKMIQDNEGRLVGKQFEWVVQVLKEGRITIPSQSFTYFDTDRSSYETLKSKTLVIQVAPGGPGSGNNTERVEKAAGSPEKAEVSRVSLNQPALDESVLVYTSGSLAPIPGIIFLIMLIFPWSVALYLFTKNTLIPRFFITHHYRSRRRFKHAYHALEQLKKNPNARALYEIFVNVVSFDIGERRSGNTSEVLYQSAVISKMSESEQRHWNLFCSTLIQYSFGPYQKVSHEFFDEAYRWLQRLQELDRN